MGYQYPLLPVAIITLIVLLARFWIKTRHSGQLRPADPSRQDLQAQRLYQYSITFISAIVGTIGAMILIEAVIEIAVPRSILARETSSLAVASGLGMLLVGGSVWRLYWTLVRRRFRENPSEERSSAIRKSYLYLLSFVAMCVLSQAAISLLEGFSASPLATIVAWGGLWLFQWSIISKEAHPTPETRTLRNYYIYTIAFYALGLLVVGISTILNKVLHTAYETIVATSIMVDTMKWPELLPSLWLLIIGGLIWSWHWFYLARGDRESPARAFASYAYTLIGLLTTLFAIVALATGILWWFLAPPRELQAALHFRLLPAGLTILSVGIGLTLYHLADFRHRAGKIDRRPIVAQRMTRAIFAFIGLTGIGSCLFIFTLMLLNAISETPKILIDQSWWRAPLTAGIVSLTIGATLWYWIWFPWQKQIGHSQEAVRSLSRRIYLYAIVGIATLTLIGAATHVLILILGEILQGHLNLQWLNENGGIAKASISLIVTALIITPYHWALLRQDRKILIKLEPPEVAYKPKSLPQVSIVNLETDTTNLVDILAALGHETVIVDKMQGGREIGRFPHSDLTAAANTIKAAQQHILAVIESGDIRLYSLE